MNVATVLTRVTTFEDGCVLFDIQSGGRTSVQTIVGPEEFADLGSPVTVLVTVEPVPA